MLQLKGYRVMAGLTQEELAKALKISRVAYCYKENGQRTFTDKEENIILEKIKTAIPNIKREDLFPI
jgi:Predicted transcriptional regulators